jgi:hypothetical protein
LVKCYGACVRLQRVVSRRLVYCSAYKNMMPSESLLC